MFGALILFMFIPILVSCSGEGNIRLLEDEVAVALKPCTDVNDNSNAKDGRENRQHRSSYANNIPRINFNSRREVTQYERHNIIDLRHEIEVPNSTSFDYEGYTAGNFLETALDSAKSMIMDNYDTDTNATRKKRNEPLIDKPDSNQCLSQCVFANLQVVDSRGIPREAELWNLVQSSVTSHQSRVALRDQIRACFQELQSEAEDNSCSYSNKLERCLMLRFADRKSIGGKASDEKAEK